MIPFFTIALKVVAGIDAFAAAELVIILAAPAPTLELDSFVAPALMSTPISLARAPRHCALGTVLGPKIIR
jgi:hypothetical protein